MTNLRNTGIAALACLALAGCKFVPTSEKQNKASVNSAQAPDQGFDAKVAGLWTDKLLPYVRSKAAPLGEVIAAVASSPDAAGAKYGYKEKGGSAPWTLLATIDGKVVAANTQSRAATLDIDADGNGTADARVQIGPVIRGTAIRDSLSFVNFNDFTNQIDFAQFGKAFNTYVDKTLLEKLPRDDLAGKQVKVVGAFPLPAAGELPLITPITIEVGP